MADGGYRGISLEQDSVRFSNKDKILLKKLAHTFPPHYDAKVNMRKVNIPVLRPWITEKVTKLLGFEDDVVIEYAVGLLEDPNVETPDPRKLQISLTGFLESKTSEFMSELWALLVSAQSSIGGIPKEFVEAKKKEMLEQREREANMVRNAAPSASTSGPPARGSESSRGRGMPYRDAQGGAEAGRGGSRGGPARPFKDKSGNVTERSRDTGWGARGGQSNDSYRAEYAPRGDARGYRTEDRYDVYGQGAYGGYDRYEGRNGDVYRGGPRSTARYHDAPRRSPTPEYTRRGSGRDDSGRHRRDSYSRSPSSRSSSRSRSPPPRARARSGSRSPAHSPPPRRRRYEDYDRAEEEPPRKLARKGKAPGGEREKRSDRDAAPTREHMSSTHSRPRRDSSSRSRSRSRSATPIMKRPSQGGRERARDERDTTPEMRRGGQADRSVTPEMARPTSRPARAIEEPQREQASGEDLEAREQRLKGRLAKSRWAE